VCLLGAYGKTATAQTLTTLYSFPGGSNGALPWADLVQGSDGNFYGTTAWGGPNDDGTVFKITPQGTLTTLWRFNGSNGEEPQAALVQGSDGNFYGTTQEGGTNNNGTVFKITSQGTLTTLWRFNGSNGYFPNGLEQGSDSNFYGTTYGGGTNGGYGTVFKITPQGTLTTLWQFGGCPTCGSGPAAALVQGADGNFYGTTGDGGANNDGTVFKITSQGTLTTLWQFGSSNGEDPLAGLVQGSDGNFYGTAQFGGMNNDGTVFRIASAGTLTTLWQFNGSNGEYPRADLVQGSDGYFYGTTANGGTSTNCTGGCGTVFRISSSGNLTTLHSFSGSDGASPYAGLVQGSDGYLYGTTYMGGASGSGTVFRISALLNSWTNAASSKWETATNWLLGKAPSVSDGADFVTNANTKTVTIDATTAASYPGTMTVNNLTLSGPSGSTNTLALSNAGTNSTPFLISGALTIGGGGLVSVANSTLEVDNAGGGNPGVDGVLIGVFGSANTLAITNGGQVVNSSGYLGYYTGSSNNVVLVTGPGSVWSSSSSGRFCVGYNGASNQLTVANGGQVVNSNDVYVGFESSADNNAVLVTGPGSVWNDVANLHVGWYGVGNQLTVTNGGTVFANHLFVARNAGGSGTLTLAGGTVNIDVLVATNGGVGVVAFNSGTLISNGTIVSNALTFAVGDGVNAATFQITAGGVLHSFANGLEIRNNASLTGCGTVSGNVVVDSGGTVLANCGGNLNFTGTVTNNGTISAVSGTTLNFFGPTVNNGTINGANGAIRFYSTFQNNGTVTGLTNSWTDGSGKWETAGNWWLNSAPSAGDAADLITNAGNKTVTIDSTTVLSNAINECLTINNLTVSAPGGATNTLFLNNAGTSTPLQVFSVLTLGTNGAMVVNNSAVQSTNFVNISNASSSLTVTNGGSLVVTNGNRTGSVVVNAGSLILGTATFKADSLIVTNGGTVQNTQTNQLNNGSTTVAGGSLVATNAPTTIGSVSNSVTTLSISSNATVLTSLTTLAAGTNSTASLTVQDAASVQILSNLTVGSGLGATGLVAMTGGSLVVTNGVIGIGNDGTATNGVGVGTMTVSNGTVLANQILLGSSAGGHGQLTVQSNGLVSLVGTGAFVACNDLVCDGGTLEIANGVIYCGYQQPGAMTMSDGAANCEFLDLGFGSQGTLTVMSGQLTVSSTLEVGFTAPGSVWMSGGQLTANNNYTTIGNSGSGQFTLSGSGTMQASTIVVGNTGGPGGTLTVSGGILTLSGSLNVGAAPQSIGTVWVSGGQLLAASGSIVIGNGSGIGQLTISSGFVQASSLALTNGANSQFALVGGALNSAGTVVTNTQSFLVGNGSSAATFNLMGGVHWFGNGLEIANNSLLSGCGTVNGNVTVDSGAMVLANCGILTFTGIVTNYGTLLADGGSTLEAYGPVVNYGTIDAINGSTNFHAGFFNHGTILTAANVAVSQVSPSGLDFVVQIQSLMGHSYQLQYTTSLTSPNWNIVGTKSGTGGLLIFTDAGATANPQRFYRVLVTAP
jgi:uncharacterized repeat protein (TIGR03803 family)/T5SS/PEP-CTERM-associated repeat protein